MVTNTQDLTSTGAQSAWARHLGPVTGVALVPGTHKVVTSAYDSAVGCFNLDTGKAELLGYHDHLVNSISVNDAGTLAASCSSDYSICIWDLEKQTRLRVLKGHDDDVEAFVFVDDATGVSASRDHRIIVWDLRSGEIRRVLEGHDKDVLAVATQGRNIYSSGDDKTLRVWNLDTGAQLKVWGPFEDETDTCAIDPQHQRAVLGCDDGCIRIFDISDGALIRVIEGHSSGIKKVAVSPASGDILSAAYDQKILVWDAESFERKVALDRKTSTWERSLTWSPDGKQILGGTFDGTLLAWNPQTGELEMEIGQGGPVAGNPCFNDISAGSDGTAALVSDDGFIRLAHIGPDGADWLGTFEPRKGRVLMNAVTLDESSALVVGGAHDHKLHIFRLGDNGLEAEVEVTLGQGPVNSVRISHHPGHEDEIFTACYSSRIVRVSPEGEVLGDIRLHEGAVKSLRLHPHEPLGISCGADGLLLSWSFDGELVQRYLGHTAIINDIDLEPGGRRAASVSRDFSLKIFDVLTGELQQSIPIGSRSLKSVCFRDATKVIIGDYWGGLIQVDLNSETWRRRVIAENGISAVSRCGDHLVVCSYDGSIHLVGPDLEILRTLRAMHQHTQRDACPPCP